LDGTILNLIVLLDFLFIARPQH